MNRSLKHLGLGLSTGVTVFAIVVPLIHVFAELAVAAGLKLGLWDNPVEIFIFIMTSLAIGVFPWGLWMILADARRAGLFDTDNEVIEYLLAAMGAHLALTLLVCTRLQALYAEFRWFCTPCLLVCAAALAWWRWRGVWGLPLAWKRR